MLLKDNQLMCESCSATRDALSSDERAEIAYSKSVLLFREALGFFLAGNADRGFESLGATIATVLLQFIKDFTVPDAKSMTKEDICKMMIDPALALIHKSILSTLQNRGLWNKNSL
jgi:hypothetical protein